jgi:sporulation protein YlmC with PRC-barrel domain
MRMTNQYLLTLASAALICGVAAGQEPAAGAAAAQPIPQTELKPGDIRASNLLGAMVKRLTGDSVGEVEELIVSADATVRLAVISVGGLLGVGAKTIAIPFEEFMVAPDGSTLYLSMSEAELNAQPAFDVETASDDLHSPADAEPVLGGQTRTESPHDLAAVSPASHAPADPSAHERLTQHDAHRDGEFAVSKSKVSRQPASTLIGAHVVDSQNQPIGTIRDLIVTAEPAEVQVVLELDGASEEPSQFVAVPLPEITVSDQTAADPHRRVESVETTLALNELQALPQFEYR